MHFLANENMPGSVIRHLREAGHDVLSAKESMQGAEDTSVLARAQAEARILISQDKDFGELAFRAGLPANCGVVRTNNTLSKGLSQNLVKDIVIAIHEMAPT